MHNESMVFDKETNDKHFD